LPEGDRCQNGNITSFYSTILELKCDKNIARLSIDNSDEISTNYCKNTIKMRSQYACPIKNKYTLSEIMENNSTMFGLILLIGGIYYTFYSYKYLKITRILTGVTTVCFFSLFLFANNLQNTSNSINFWLIFILSAIIGLCLGWIISKIPWIVSCVLGGFLGFIFTELLYQGIFSLLSWNPKAVYYIIFSVAVLTGCILGGIFQKHIFIISCAFLGSYSIIRGVGVLEHNFPDEQQLVDLIERGEWPQVYEMMGYIIYIYLIFSFIMGILGTCYQYRFYFKDIKSDDRDFLNTN
jgi:hypothetical protein